MVAFRARLLLLSLRLRRCLLRLGCGCLLLGGRRLLLLRRGLCGHLVLRWRLRCSGPIHLCLRGSAFHDRRLCLCGRLTTALGGSAVKRGARLRLCLRCHPRHLPPPPPPPPRSLLRVSIPDGSFIPNLCLGRLGSVSFRLKSRCLARASNDCIVGLELFL